MWQELPARAAPPFAEEGTAAAPPDPRPASTIPQGGVDVAGAAGEVGAPLRHEGDGLALQVGDLLYAVLVEHVPVRHRERLGVVEGQLLLARPPLALALQHLQPGRVHAVAD